MAPFTSSAISKQIARTSRRCSCLTFHEINPARPLRLKSPHDEGLLQNQRPSRRLSPNPNLSKMLPHQYRRRHLLPPNLIPKDCPVLILWLAPSQREQTRHQRRLLVARLAQSQGQYLPLRRPRTPYTLRPSQMRSQEQIDQRRR